MILKHIVLNSVKNKGDDLEFYKILWWKPHIMSFRDAGIFSKRGGPINGEAPIRA